MDFLLPGRDDPNKHELTIPGTEKVVQARFLDGTEPKWENGVSARETLAALGDLLRQSLLRPHHRQPPVGLFPRHRSGRAGR